MFSWFNRMFVQSKLVPEILKQQTNSLLSPTYKETLERKKKDGIHKAVYSLLTLLLDQDATVLQAFWSNLCKEYNKDCYPKLETLFMNLPKGTVHRPGKHTITVLEDNDSLSDDNLIWQG